MELKNMSDLSDRQTNCSSPLLGTRGQYPSEWRVTTEGQEVKVCMENEGKEFPEYNDTLAPRAADETNVENGFDNNGNRVDLPEDLVHPVTNSLCAEPGRPCGCSAWLKYPLFLLALLSAAIGGGLFVILFQQTADSVHVSSVCLFLFFCIVCGVRGVGFHIFTIL